MYVRLAFAVAAHLEPEILLVDEVLAVGDAEFQRRCLGRMEELGRSGRTVLFVSHQLPAVAQLCDRALWINGGRVDRRRASRRRDRELPPSDAQLGVGAHVDGRDRARRRPCEDPLGSRAPSRTDAARRGRRAQPGGNRDRVPGATRRQARLPEDQGAGSGVGDRLQRDGYGRAVAERDARRASTSRRRGSRGIS